MDFKPQKMLVVCPYTKGLLNFQGQLLERIVEQGYDVTVCGPYENIDIRARFDAMKVKFINVPLNRSGMNPFNEISSVLALKKVFSENCPDKILTTGLKAILLGSLINFFNGRVEIYSMFQGLGHTFTDNSFRVKIINLIVKYVCRFSLIRNKGVFFLNPDDLKVFVEGKIIRKEQAVLVNGCGVDLDQFQVTRAKLEGPVFLMIARLIKNKGVREYVEAARIIKLKYPEVRVQLLGSLDAHPSSLPREFVEEAGIIEYIGPTKDVRPYIKNCSVYVLPSYREGVPRSVMEAMAMARPIIVTDVPGCRETIVDGENGFMVPSRDIPALANAMERFISNPQLIEPMGLVSRRMVEEKFDVHKVNENLMREMEIV